MRLITIKYILLSTLSLFSIHLLLSQEQNNIWCFGNHAGLDFNGPNVSAIQSQVQTVTNTASVSDPRQPSLLYGWQNGLGSQSSCYAQWNRT